MHVVHLRKLSKSNLCLHLYYMVCDVCSYLKYQIITNHYRVVDQIYPDDMMENDEPTLTSGAPVKSTKVAPIEPGENKLGMSGPGYQKEASVYKALRSLHLFLLIGGLVFEKDFSKTGIRRHLTPGHVYSYTVLVFLVANFARYITMFRGDDSFGYLLFMKIIFCTWILETLGQYMSFVVSSECRRLPAFFEQFEEVGMNCRRSLTSITRLSNICTAILWILFILNAVFIVYITWFTDMLNIALAPWNEDSENIFLIRILNMILEFYIAIEATASSIFMFTICKILAAEFHQISSSIKKMSMANIATATTAFESIRQHHQKLCNLVRKADCMFSMQIAFSLSGNTLIVCLMIYIGIYNGSEEQERGMVIIIVVFWIMVPILKVVTDCVSGAILNDAVRLAFTTKS